MRGAFFGFSLFSLAFQAVSIHFSALDQGAKLPGAGNLPAAAGPAGTVEGPALRRPNRSRAFAPGPVQPSLPIPSSVASPGGEELYEHEARRARVRDATLEVVVREFQHVGGSCKAGRGEKERHSLQQR